MPVVSATLTDAELRRWDVEENIKPKSLGQLGREAQWILDGLGPDDRDYVLHLAPAVMRFVLVYGFGRSYRRRSTASWHPPAAREVQKHGRTAVVAPAGPQAVWDVVSDVTRVGEWSHECVGAEWLDGATAAVPGARFRGRNRSGLFRWGRICEIVTAEPWELTWRTVPTILYPDSTEWTIRLEAVAGGTRIGQSFRVVEAPKLVDRLYATMVPHHRDRDEALAGDLRRLGEVAAEAVAPVTGVAA
jgi:Polyketide cyclase / dehydrase and lipid transport